jgi:hypothetical protein
MSLEQHYGFKPSETPSIFSVDGLMLTEAKKFQPGFNNLFVMNYSQQAAEYRSSSVTLSQQAAENVPSEIHKDRKTFEAVRVKLRFLSQVSAKQPL